jgi:hypothetical protein
MAAVRAADCRQPRYEETYPRQVAVSLSAVCRRHPTRRQHPPDYPYDKGSKSYRAGRPRSPRLGTIKKVTGLGLSS